jgi:hypothetical protein
LSAGAAAAAPTSCRYVSRRAAPGTGEACLHASGDVADKTTDRDAADLGRAAELARKPPASVRLHLHAHEPAAAENREQAYTGDDVRGDAWRHTRVVHVHHEDRVGEVGCAQRLRGVEDLRSTPL